MKKIVLTAVLVWISLYDFAQTTDSAATQRMNGSQNKTNQVLSTARPLPGDETVAAIKEALVQGVNASTSRLAASSGYFKDAAVKIGLPEDIRKLEPKFRTLGMGNVLDQTVQSMNEAAEDAAKSAAAIFINVIKQMKVTNATGILKGSDTAATWYLKKTAYNDVAIAWRPVVESSMKKMNTAQYWAETLVVYNKLAIFPLTINVTEYVTDQALKGLFFYIGEEEKKIRNNPAARESSLLKKVFANQ